MPTILFFNNRAAVQTFVHKLISIRGCFSSKGTFVTRKKMDPRKRIFKIIMKHTYDIVPQTNLALLCVSETYYASLKLIFFFTYNISFLSGPIPILAYMLHAPGFSQSIHGAKIAHCGQK